MEIIRRSYKETWFWLLLAGIVYTFLTETLGLSSIEVKNYTEGVVKKVATNISGMYIFIGSIILMVKTTIENIQKRSINKELMLAKIAKHIKHGIESYTEDKAEIKPEAGDRVTRNIILTNDELRNLFELFNDYIREQIKDNKTKERGRDGKREGSKEA